MTAVSTIQSRNYLPLTVAMMTCLILLINVSFKIIAIKGIFFTASSVLCPLVAALYFLVLKACTVQQQRQVLIQSLVTLYLFSIGIFLLVNLPSAENVQDTIAYQVIFEDIPKKFFSATVSFGVSFFLPHLFFSSRKSPILTIPKYRLLLVLLGGFLFFFIDSVLLFSDSNIENIMQVSMDSTIITIGLLFAIGIIYLYYLMLGKSKKIIKPRKIAPYFLSPIYHYLVGFSVIILMICLACEYRIISLSGGLGIAASGVLSPLIIIVSNLIGELFGCKANLRMLVILIISELIFDLLLMLAVVLPSPDFFNLNPFYHVIMPRRIPAATLALFFSIGSNALLLEKLRNTVYGDHQVFRIFVANILANSLLCIVNYSILFAGIFPGEQIFNLALNSWIYKFIITIGTLPLVHWIIKGWHSHSTRELTLG